MSSHRTSDQYDAHYYAHSCGTPYERNEHWLRFFGNIADHIVQEISPGSVLDAGCAMGFLVEALRDRGVEAYGLDISDFAIQQVRPDIRPYCWVGSVTDPLPRRYDLIVCIEVLEHLRPEEAGTAVENLCRHADDILFSSTPSDFQEATHRNVQPPDYWAELFARHGFFRDLEFDASYITAWAARFRKSREPVARIVAAYERRLWQLTEEGRSDHGPEAEERERRERDAAAIRELEHQRRELEGRLQDTEAQLRQVRMQLQAVTETATWRVIDGVHRRARRLLPPDTRRGSFLTVATLGARVLVEQGPRAFLRNLVRVRWWSRRIVSGVSRDQQYREWLERNEPGPATLAAMRSESEQWDDRPLVSIIMPVYNPKAEWLRQAIQSVVDQAYINWELCIADDASTEPHVREVLEEFARSDPRVKVTYRQENGGIVAASNDALKLASGDLIGFLDHDDLLRPHALYEVVRYLRERPETDVVYSDEDKVMPGGSLGQPFFKPDWSPDLLLSVNYLNHFTVIRRELVDAVGGFRAGYDGSQDYDLFLRVTERARAVGHIPKPLYSWRMAPGSAAASAAAKPYAYLAATRALQDAMQRRGIAATVDQGPSTGWFHVRYAIKGAPLVSIIIATRDRADLLQRCIDSIERKSTYAPWEILVVDNDSKEPETLHYLRQLPHQVIPFPGPFNYARMMNEAVTHARGTHIVFLNNDTEVITPDWIQALLEHSQRPEVAAVGARLLYPDGRVQHEGIILGLGGGSALNVDCQGYFNLGESIRNCSAVTAACMMVRRDVFQELNGFDEELGVAFNDVDYCLRAREKGYLIVYTPLAKLYHYEGASRGRLHPLSDEVGFRKRWGDPGTYRDPYYNPNLDLRRPFHLRLD